MVISQSESPQSLYATFQTQTTAYRSLAKEEPQIRISNQGKEISYLLVFLRIFLLENFDFSLQLREIWQLLSRKIIT